MVAISAQEYEARIKALEQQCAVLAAQVDRMRPVVEAAQVLTCSLRRHEPASWIGTEEALERAITAYEQQMAQLAKEGRDDGVSTR
jgi:hypothetical protein